MQFINQTISVRDVQRQYKDVALLVGKSKKPLIVMNRSQAQIALLSLKQLEEYERLKFFYSLEDIRSKNKDIDFNESYNDITAEVESVRKKRYAKTSRSY